jgi:hypothetical protein
VVEGYAHIDGYAGHQVGLGRLQSDGGYHIGVRGE